MKIVIVSGGTPPSYNLIKKELQDSEFLICADSGGNCLYKYNIVPDYIMGDFDSIDIEALNFFKDEEKCLVETYPQDKDFTDTELVLNKALELGGTDIVFLGCTGTRLDHLMGNIGMLLRCLNMNVRSSIKDDHNTIYITDKTLKIKGERGENFSIQAYSEVVQSVSIRGAKYRLDNYDLKLGDPRTISNQFLDSEVEIDFKNGVLLIFYSRD